MEMNPRFEGSLDLAIRAGINFPLLLIKIMAQKFNGENKQWQVQ